MRIVVTLVAMMALLLASLVAAAPTDFQILVFDEQHQTYVQSGEFRLPAPRPSSPARRAESIRSALPTTFGLASSPAEIRTQLELASQYLLDHQHPDGLWGGEIAGEANHQAASSELNLQGPNGEGLNNGFLATNNTDFLIDSTSLSGSPEWGSVLALNVLMTQTPVSPATWVSHYDQATEFMVNSSTVFPGSPEFAATAILEWFDRTANFASTFPADAYADRYTDAHVRVQRHLDLRIPPNLPSGKGFFLGFWDLASTIVAALQVSDTTYAEALVSELTTTQVFDQFPGGVDLLDYAISRSMTATAASPPVDQEKGAVYGGGDFLRALVLLEQAGGTLADPGAIQDLRDLLQDKINNGGSDVPILYETGETMAYVQDLAYAGRAFAVDYQYNGVVQSRDNATACANYLLNVLQQANGAFSDDGGATVYSEVHAEAIFGITHALRQVDFVPFPVELSVFSTD